MKLAKSLVLVAVLVSMISVWGNTRTANAQASVPKLTVDEVYEWCKAAGCIKEQLAQTPEANGLINPRAVTFYSGLNGGVQWARFTVPAGVRVEGWDCFDPIHEVGPVAIERVCAATFRATGPRTSNQVATHQEAQPHQQPATQSSNDPKPAPVSYPSDQCPGEGNWHLENVGGDGSWTYIGNGGYAYEGKPAYMVVPFKAKVLQSDTSEEWGPGYMNVFVKARATVWYGKQCEF